MSNRTPRALPRPRLGAIAQRLAPALVVAALAAFSAPTLAQEKVLRIAMTAADIPRTLGQPDQGFEGNRFTGITMYDALTHWDLSKADAPSVVIPGLALSWAVDAKDKTKWVFKLRPGVKFHDGSDFNADAVVWNVRKVLDNTAVHFDASQVGVTASRMPTLRSARKIDNLTVELTTSEPDSFLPINLTNLFMASPAHWQKKFDAAPGATPADKSRAAWTAFAADASGSGPFKMARFVPRERVEMVAHKTYWDPKRVPKIDRVVLLPMPEANARTAALLSGQVDWIEAPAPDAMGAIQSRGNKIYFNQQPHVWPWQLSFAEGSPWLDKRVRQAANLCVDRLGLMKLLGGMMVPPKGTVPPGHPWWGNPKFDIKTDIPAAQKLMAEAGHSAAKPLRVKVQISASGFGPDAAAADERVRAAEPEAVLLRRAVRRHRVEHAVHQLAQGRQGSVGQRFQRHQRELLGDGPVLRDGALRQHQDLPAGEQQLGLLRQRDGGQAHRRRPHQLRREIARRRAGQAARPHRRRHAVRVDRARRGPARAEPADRGRGAAAALVHRHRADVDEVTGR
jgi:peptide/nickel transport system substrate-binding protein